MSNLAESIAPLVTVVTPTYNVAKYIGDAVSSVLRQTFRDFEYIIVDDGSTDNSIDIVEALTVTDPRCRIVRRPNGGVAAARNSGIREARGTYIAFLDGDDEWHPRFLERQVSLIESLPKDVGLVFARSRMLLENGTPLFFQRMRSGRYDFDDFLIGANPARNGSSLLIRTSCFDEVGLFDENIRSVEDFEMWLRIADQSTTPVLWGSRYYLVDQRLRPGSVTRDREASDKALQEMFDAYVPKLRHVPAGLAYVRPAAYALKYGLTDPSSSELVANARSAGMRELMRTGLWGWRFLFWDTLPESGRGLLRDAQSGTREAVKTANLRMRRGSAR